jgi:hypothetical protein
MASKKTFSNALFVGRCTGPGADLAENIFLCEKDLGGLGIRVLNSGFRVQDTELRV